MENTAEMDATNSSNKPRLIGFEFKGDGMEYFKIWIVNVLLSILTLGIYSAWAKVRTNRYFYSNLYLDDSNFRYLAAPLTILKGRIIAIVAFIVYTIVSAILPILGVMMIVALLFAIPYFVNQSMAFNSRMTSYKNIQFRFSASYWQAFMVIYIWPILGLLSFGILYPLALLKMHEYLVKNSSYGTTKFDFNATYKEYGMIFLVMIGVLLVVGLPMWGLIMMVPTLALISPIVIAVVYIGLILFAIVKINNLYISSISLIDHRFEASLSIGSLGLVMLINLLLTIVTLGLYLPAAKVRMTKYFSSHIVMHATDSLDNFAAAEKENISALGEEFGEVFDFGI